MARPTKQGVDYFPLDVHLDDKFKFIEIKYKLEGFAILIKLMQRIYSQGYWCMWTADEQLLFSDEVKADFALVQNVVNEYLKRDVFSKELYDSYNILTSTGIQTRYKEIVRRRKEVEVTEEYLLIDGISKVTDDINPSTSKHDEYNKGTPSEQDDGKSTQSKLNKTKQKEDKYSAEFEEFWSVYPKKADKGKSYKSFKSKRKKHSLEVMIEGAKRYAKQIKKYGTEKRFIKNGSTFLNNDSFLDEYDFELSDEKQENAKSLVDELIVKRDHLEGSLNLDDDYYEMSGQEFDREATRKELDQVEQQLRDHQR